MHILDTSTARSKVKSAQGGGLFKTAPNGTAILHSGQTSRLRSSSEEGHDSSSGDYRLSESGGKSPGGSM